MKSSSLGFRLAASSFLVVLAIVFLFGGIAWQFVAARIHRQASLEATAQLNLMLNRLATIDELTRRQVESGMRLLEDEGGRRGRPSVEGTAEIGGNPVPDLRLGAESEVGNYAMVDHVKQLSGVTATLFVWNGQDFIRVTTNVLKPDGSRAVGTVLDRKGNAYAALIERRRFDGVVDILGVPYTTSYVPMLDAKGSLVGARYTGNRLDSIAALGKSIADTVILDRGFIALLKPSGDVVFRGKNVSETQVKELAAKSDGWVVQRQTFPAWGYAVMTAYPTSDVWLRILEPSVAMAAGILGLSAVVVLFQFVLLERLVLRPVRKLAQEMADADLNSLMETGRNDEIGKLADSFNRFVLRLRHTLLQVRAGSAASTAKSNEIRGVSSDAVSLMNDQLRCAEDANAAVSHLSQQIDSTARHTDEALERARSAASEARAGGELVASTVTRIQALARGTEQSAGRIASLSERVQQIGSIVEVIEEIAAGTNLLALNASIEAARAGQQGRGFAVVAGEVRRLAERTAQATQQVSSLVGGIKDETGQAAEDILAACTHAREGAEAIAGLNSRFKQISQLVIEVDGRIEQIAEAAREEASAASALSERVNVVASSARQSASGAEQVVGASGELLGIAKKLENMVERFQMRDLPQDCEELFVGGC